jgi:hypothetical protein
MPSSIDLELRARRILGSAAEKVGSPAVSLALLGLVVAYGAAAALVGGSGGAPRLEDSPTFYLLAATALADGLASLLKGVPLGRDEGGGIALRTPAPGEWGALLLRGAWLLVGVAFATSLLSRDVHTLRIAEGEAATGDPAQLTGRDEPRLYSPGPFPVAFTVARVDGRPREDGSAEGIAVGIREPDGRFRRVTALRPLVAGWGRLLIPHRAGWTLRYAVAVEKGGELDSAWAKLDLLPAGRWQEVRSDVIPHRILFAVPEGAVAAGSAAPGLRAVILRNGLTVGEGALQGGGGGSVRFDGLVMTAPEMRKWVEFRMVDDSGPFLLGVASLIAIAGLIVSALTRKRVGRG